MVDERFVGKDVPQPQFADDDGRVAPHVGDALLAWRRGTLPFNGALLALIGSRVFVPVVAMLDSMDVTDTGERVEKDSHMATVTLEGGDGLRRFLAFSSTAELSAWNPEARPIAVYFSQACEAAVSEGAEGLIVDIATEPAFVLPGAQVRAGVTSALGIELFSLTAGPALIREALAPVAHAFDVEFELVAAQNPRHVARLVIVGAEETVRAAAQVVATSLAHSEDLAALTPSGLEVGGRATDL